MSNRGRHAVESSADRLTSRRPGGRRLNWGTKSGWMLAVVLLLFAGYLVLFYRTILPSVGSGLRRIDLVQFGLLLPEDYFAVWFGNPPEFALADRLPVLGVALGILAISAIFGRQLISLFRMDWGLTSLERVLFSCGVGLNTVSLYVLLVGLLGWLRRPLAFAIPAIAIVVTFLVGTLYRIRTRGRVPRSHDENGAAPSDMTRPVVAGDKDWLNRKWILLAAPFVLAITLGGMLPPIDFDVREYHLQVPKEFYQAGRVTFLRHNIYGNMALGSEMLSLLAMIAMGDWWYGALAGKTLIAAITTLTALGVLAAGKRFFSTTAGIVAALVYISIPWVAQVSTSGLVEGVSAFYLLLAVYAVLLWRQAPGHQAPDRRVIDEAAMDQAAIDPLPDDRRTRGLSRVLLAGYLAGAAVACKYPAALFVVVPLTAWKWLAGGRTNWRPAAAFLLAVLAGCGLWFGKNWVLAENPTYPLLFNVFGGATRTVEKNAQWQMAHYPQGYSPSQLLDGLAAVGWRSEWLSPLLLPLAALALLVREHRRSAIALWLFFLYVVIAWWLFTHRIDRFWIPALPVLALLAGLGATWSMSRVWRKALLASLVFGLLFNLIFVVSGAGGYNAYFNSLARLRGDGDRTNPWHRLLNRIVPEGSRVLSVGDAEVFDLEVPVVYNTVFDDLEFESICRGRTPTQIHAELHTRRISHIYVAWGEIARYRRPGNYGFPAFVRPGLFEQLVRLGVLEPPMVMDMVAGAVFVVRPFEEKSFDPHEKKSSEPILVPGPMRS